MPLSQERKKYTYTDYLSWPEDERAELIDGVPYTQAAPSWEHQALSVALLVQFHHSLAGTNCQVFAAPFDLRLPNEGETDEETTTVLQPDIVVVCDRDKLKGTGYFGTPPLIIEVSSPSTTRRDRVFKFNKYEQAGVKEYWIVEPHGKYVNVFTLQDNNRYGRPQSYTDEEIVNVSVLSDVVIDLSEVFAAIG